MANYRRLISYIYAYEGGTKGKNVGFAKIENRKDQCRIQSVCEMCMWEVRISAFI